MQLEKLGKNIDVIHLSGGAGRILFSYGEPVAAHIPGRGHVKTDKYFSRTTAAHVAAWLKAEAAARDAVVVAVKIIEHEELLRIAGQAL